MRRSVEPETDRITILRCSPAFISVDEAVAALVSLYDRRTEPAIAELVDRISWLGRPTILPGWRWR